MTTITFLSQSTKGSIPMTDLRPGEVAKVISPNSEIAWNAEGHWVMRTLNSDRFEVMDLTEFNTDCCWVGNAKSISAIEVVPLQKGQTLKLAIVGER